MKKKLLAIVCMVCMLAIALAGCGGKETTGGAASEGEVINQGSSAQSEVTTAAQQETAAAGTAAELEDGVYVVDVETDSSMFHLNETKNGKGELTVKNGQMTVHITLVSKNIVNLFAGTAEDAEKEGAVLIEPTVDKVTYEDGMTEEVYGFDVPIPALEVPVDVAILGTKGKWYSHTIIVSNPVPAE